MTVATSDFALDDYAIDRARRFGVDHLIGTPEQSTALAWIANATADPTRLARPGGEIAPYAGTTEVTWLHATSAPGRTTKQPAAAPSALVATAHPSPITPPVVVPAPTQPVVDTIADVRKQPRPFEEGFEFIEWRDLRNRKVPHAIAMCRLIRLENINANGDICEQVTYLERLFGTDAETLRTWLKPGGPLSDRFVLRNYATGGHATTSADGHLMWRIESVPANSAYDSVVGDEAALFKVKVPHQWLYLHPSQAEGSEWVGGQQVERRVTNRKTKRKELRMVWEPAVYAEGMLYAVITLRAIKSATRVTNPSVPGLARAFNAVKPRQMTNLLAQAEDAGLITVEGSRSGRVAPLRRWHTVPVDESKRTSPTRMKAWAAGHNHMVEPEPTESSDAPF